LETILSSKGKRVVIASHRPLVMIGERINPTGRERLARSLARGDTSLAVREAQAQVEAGAQVIDINVSAAEVEEREVLPLAVRAVAEAVDIPISIDSSDAQALAAALAVCPGKPLVNSVTGEEKALEAILPLVKERGAAVVGLCMDEEGIPSQARRRVEIARKILARAERWGIAPDEVIIDPLAMSAGADSKAALVTLETIRLLAQDLGANVIVAASNVSFGLPERPLLNATFLAMAISQGLTCALVNPLDVEMRKAVVAGELLMGRDEFALGYLSRYRAGW
jgi:5-methyltetrahydrofolate--homocysteine methyltransferase